MMMRKNLFALAVLLVAIAVGPAARADDAPSPAALKEARAHFLQGKAFQDAGAFDQAIVEYQVAYKLAPLPDLIFNLAQCQRLKGDKRGALADYQRYLATAPDGRGAPDARRFVAMLTREVAEQDAQAAAQQAEAERQRRETEQAAASAERARREAEARALAASGPAGEAAAAPTLQTGPAPNAKLGRRLRIGGLVAAGVGVALIGGGIAFGIKARSAGDDLQKLEDGGTWDQGLYDSGRAASRNMIILVAAGSAALVGGAVAYFFGRRALSVEPVAGGATLSLTTRR